MAGYEYSAVLPEQTEELTRLGELLSQALHFNMTPEQLSDWLGRGLQLFRAVHDNGKMAAGLGIIEAGQWFGGNKLPIAAISPVGTALDYRGRGAGSVLLQKMHEEVRAFGWPLSVLYPATLGFYRRAGYEKAGQWNTWELPTHAIDAKYRDMEVVPVSGAEDPEVRGAYEARARESNGHLARWELLWKRLLEPKDKICHRYLVRRDGRTEGYAAFIPGGQVEKTRVSDFCALTREAALRLLTLFADDRTMTSDIIWRSGATDPFLYLLGEQKAKLNDQFDWVLRVVDVERALLLRGYPLGLNGELSLDIQDEQLPWNNGRFVLELSDGQPSVRRGGAGEMKLDIRAFATLFTGYLTPRELRLAGRLDAEERPLAFAQMAFSGPHPWMPDIF